MRRQTQRRLAHLGRLLLLAASLGAATTGVVFAAKPDWVLRFENWSRRKLHGSDWAFYNDAIAAEKAGDLRRARAAMVELSDRLLEVKRLDRRVELLNLCHEWLWSTDARNGDREGRLRSARTMVAFNERDTSWVMRLGGVLCEDPATRREGIDRLQLTWDQVPGHPDITPTLVRALLAEGETVRARNLLLASRDAPQSNWWTVRWQGVVDAPPRRAHLVPRVGSDGSLRAEFTIREPDLQGFAFEPAKFAAFDLDSAVVAVKSGTYEVSVPLSAAAPELRMCRLEGDALVLDGEPAPRFIIVLPKKLAGPDHEISLRGRYRPTLPRALATAILETDAERMLADDDGRTPAVRSRWLDARRAALAGLGAAVYWGKGASFTEANRIPIRLRGEPAGEDVRCTAAVTLPEPIAELRLSLPEGLRLSFRGLRIELAGESGDRLAALGIGDVVSSNGVAVDAGELAVTDPADPWIALRVPPGLPPIRRLAIEAVTR